jgi:homogentisate 1,2-dioxygenase
MRKYISFPHSEGRASRQAHADFGPDLYERELGKEGFFGPATHMYHQHPPTAWSSWEGPLRPRAFDLNKIQGERRCPWDAVAFLSNAHCRMRWWRAPARMGHLARNADGDELLFVHRGRGDLFCDYGHLAIEQGDYVVIPRSTMWRITSAEPIAALLIEANGSTYQLPDRGIVGQHAVFDPAVLEPPRIDDAFRAQYHEPGPGGAWHVRIKRGGAVSTVTYGFNPLDAVGWKGDLAPVRLNVRDIRPLASHRYHLPPSAHTTWVANRFVVCTFAPRPFETDPGALKVPFFHSNDDYDEVLFYHAGDFFSRDNIEAGMVTFHPCGFTHGPHPKALGAAWKARKAETDEYAVMVDTHDALEVGELPAGVEWTGYVDSWKTPTPAAAAE